MAELFKELKYLGDIKSIYILKYIFSYINERQKFNMIVYNKKIQKIFGIDIENYKKISGKYKIDGKNGEGKEYILNTNELIFEGEYKENVFAKYLKLIFNELEDNNFLTTLLEINNKEPIRLDKNDKGARPNNSKIIKELETKFLKEIKVDNDKKYEPKFLSNYKVPGFYRFYKTLSDYLTKDIDTEFLNNEKYLRDIDLNEDPKPNIAKELEDFHEKEEELLKRF